MPCDWTHHLKHEWTLEMPKFSVDDNIAAEIEKELNESVAAQVRAEINLSKRPAEPEQEVEVPVRRKKKEEVR